MNINSAKFKINVTIMFFKKYSYYTQIVVEQLKLLNAEIFIK
jgi:hypothetical protein